jgi:hypothetical protein
VGDAITLAQVAAKIQMLEIACNKCGRCGRQGVQNLIAVHGAGIGLPELKDKLAKGCPRLENPRYDDRCHAHFGVTVLMVQNCTLGGFQKTAYRGSADLGVTTEFGL